MFPLHTKPKIIFSLLSEISAKQKIHYLHSCFPDTYATVSGLHFLFLAGLPKNIPLVNSSNMDQFRLEVGRWCLVDFCLLLFRLNRFHFIILSVSQNWDNISCHSLFFDLDGRFKIIIKVLMHILIQIFSFRTFFFFIILIICIIFRNILAEVFFAA